MYKVGLIGESSGNGHPFSWQSIFNGYNKSTIAKCGYPVISDYLSKESWTRDHIKGFRITKIWTDNPSRTEFISSTSKHCESCINIDQLISEVDAIIVARDDYYPNEYILKKVIPSGKPILFDKQISFSLEKTKEMLKLAEEHNIAIFSGSAIGFDSSFNIKKLLENPKIKRINAISPKVWFNYGIHIVDPFIRALKNLDGFYINSRKRIQSIKDFKDGISLIVHRPNMDELLVDISTCQLYKGSFCFQSFDEKDFLISELVHKDTFNAFKNYLNSFANIVKDFYSSKTYPDNFLNYNNEINLESSLLLDIIPSI